MRRSAASFVLLATVLAACDPQVSLRIRNDTDRDYIVTWIDRESGAGEYLFPGAVLVPAEAAGYAFSLSGDPYEDMMILLLTPTCKVAGALLASGSEIDLRISGVPPGYLEQVEDRIEGPELVQSPDCIAE
jgi:hypothetical protein